MRQKRSVRLLAGFAVTAILMSATPSLAAWEGSRAETIVATGLDAVIVRPLAAVRVAVGAVFMIPAALFASPSGMDGINGAREVLLDEPIDYAFRRKLGEF